MVKRFVNKGDTFFTVTVYFLLILFCILTLYPLIYIVSCSLSDPEAVYRGDVFLLPVKFSVKSYERVLNNSEIWTGYKNTIIYTAVGTFLSVAFTMMSAYPLTRKDLKGRQVFMTLYVITMFFGGGIVPLYIVVDSLGMIDTMWGVILPGCVSVWNLIVVRTYINTSLPFELQEAAMIDGADGFRLFFRIVLPLCKPVILIMVLFYLVGYWNNYFNALMFLSTAEKYTLQLVLRNILITQDLNGMIGSGGSQENLYQQAILSESLKYSSIVVSTLPILLIYPFLSKYFEKGMVIGSLKG